MNSYIYKENIDNNADLAIKKELQNLLEEAILLDGGFKGLLQFFDFANGVLRPAAQVGFNEEFLTLFKVIKPFDPTACGRALGIKGPIVIDNVLEDIAFKPFRSVIIKEGFLSVKSIPLFDSNNQIVVEIPRKVTTLFRLNVTTFFRAKVTTVFASN